MDEDKLVTIVFFEIVVCGLLLIAILNLFSR